MLPIFSPDSWLMKVLSRFADLVILNILYLITCLPVITIGAATTSLYTVLFPLGTVNDKGLFKTYFRAFKENFKSATISWLILLVVGALVGADFFLFYNMSGTIRYLAAFPAILLAIEGITLSYAFPLQSLFDNTIMGTFKNALILGLANLPRSIFMLALNVFPWVMFLRYPFFFFNSAFMWVLVYFSGAAYINCLLLRKVVRPYLPDESFLPEEVAEAMAEEDEQ